VKLSIRSRSWSPPKPAFTGFRFPPEVIVVAVRWYLRFNPSYRDVEELLAERGVEVDHVSVFCWVQRFAPLLSDASHGDLGSRSSRPDGWSYALQHGVFYRWIDGAGFEERALRQHANRHR
jgi:hypothetical protein